ncbi:MAG: FKBP-type peptidyl-prolyl cis-trans isomerase [Pseudomonadales bacterium]|nr:FKBP-type peptidyl-prolyl cis-trans isomerase [Pseudomonadales bacterium]NRA17452.1 FKBP-type peptidyl-prolyl cis-trans isomerase [Oceanospirillaceae bacterium]
MKKTLIALALSAALSAPAFAATLDTEEQKLSYSFGLMIAKQIKSGFGNLDIKAFNAAMKDVFADADPQLSEAEVEAVLNKFQQQQAAKQQVEAAELAAANKAAAEEKAKVNMQIGKKFLAENAKREGVTTTESGLQIEIIAAGTGSAPTLEDTVVVHYKGSTIDENVFDSSYKRDKPATFPLSRVIKGWTEGLQLIKEGGKAKLYIPSELAYGLQGAGADIGPGETLIFEVELIEIVKNEANK